MFHLLLQALHFGPLFLHTRLQQRIALRQPRDSGCEPLLLAQLRILLLQPGAQFRLDPVRHEECPFDVFLLLLQRSLERGQLTLVEAEALDLEVLLLDVCLEGRSPLQVFQQRSLQPLKVSFASAQQALRLLDFSHARVEFRRGFLHFPALLRQLLTERRLAALDDLLGCDQPIDVIHALERESLQFVPLRRQFSHRQREDGDRLAVRDAHILQRAPFQPPRSHGDGALEQRSKQRRQRSGLDCCRQRRVLHTMVAIRRTDEIVDIGTDLILAPRPLDTQLQAYAPHRAAPVRQQLVVGRQHAADARTGFARFDEVLRPHQVGVRQGPSIASLQRECNFPGVTHHQDYLGLDPLLRQNR